MASNLAVYNLLKDYIPLQSEAIESSIQSIETKTGFIMASIGVFIPIIVTDVVDGQNSINWFFITGVFFALVTLLFNIFCMWGRDFSVSPNIRKFYDRYMSNSNDDLIREELLILSYSDFEYNRNLLRQKASSFNISLITFGLSVIFIIIGVFVNPPQKDYNTLIKSTSANVYVKTK